MHLISALKRLSQEDCGKSEAKLGWTVEVQANLCYNVRPCLKTKNKTQQQPSVVLQALNPNIWETEAGRSQWVWRQMVYILSSRSTRVTQWEPVLKRKKKTNQPTKTFWANTIKLGLFNAFWNFQGVEVRAHHKQHMEGWNRQQVG